MEVLVDNFNYGIMMIYSKYPVFDSCEDKKQPQSLYLRAFWLFCFLLRYVLYYFSFDSVLV